jgi:hypothetical protein
VKLADKKGRDCVVQNVEVLAGRLYASPSSEKDLTDYRPSIGAKTHFASIIASRRSVLTRSPDFIGISEGVTTTQLCPRPVSKR